MVFKMKLLLVHYVISMLTTNRCGPHSEGEQTAQGIPWSGLFVTCGHSVTSRDGMLGPALFEVSDVPSN